MAEAVSMDHSPGMLGTQGSGEVAAKAGAMERPEDYLKLAEGSMEAVQKMFSSLKFNNEQCGYLADKLKVVVQSGSSFLEVLMGKVDERFSSGDNTGLAEIFKLLVALGKQIESFVEGCCKDAWIQAAMTLTNVSQYVSSLGFNLELCRVAFCVDIAVSGCLTSDEVAGINKTEADIVEKKASADAHLLLEKLLRALNSLHGEDRDLAGYLLQRVLRFNPNITFEDETFLSKLSASFEDGTFLRNLFASFEDGTFLGKLFAWAKPVEQVGRGASATVFKARWLGTWVAKKTFEGSNNAEFEKEVEILSRLYHSNITSMFCCAKNKQKCSIIMELMDGDLNQLMERKCDGSADSDSAPFPILEAVDIMDQIGEGVKYLHSKRIVHRDLKSKNILYKKVKARDLDTGYVHVKVTDFGVSKTRDESAINSDLTFNVGTNRWMPPEVMALVGGKSKRRWLAGDEAPSYPFKVDTYSFGMVCYEILTGHQPFDHGNQNGKDIKRRVMEKERPELPDDCPPELKTLIEKCWSQKPTERPTFAEICGELKYLKYLLISESKMHLDAFHEPKFNEGDGTGPAVESHSVAALEPQAQESLQKVPSLLNHRSDYPISQSYRSASFYQSPDNQSLMLPPRYRSDSLSNQIDIQEDDDTKTRKVISAKAPDPGPKQHPGSSSRKGGRPCKAITTKDMDFLESSPPDLLYGSSREMVGYDRMCEIARNRFVRHKGVGAAVLGLYGTTGRGKTTLCKALCDRFFAEFLGRVCYVELVEMLTMELQETMLERRKLMLKRPKLMLKSVKLMLKNLCGIERDILDSITDVRQGLERLRDHVHREPVFLAIDNVTGDKSLLREAREYLEVGFHPKSRILITSRSVANVQELLSGVQFCMAMPRLRVKEAGEIFLRRAAPMKSISGLTDEERPIVGRCIQQCLVDAEGDEESCEPDVEEKQLLIESDVWESRWRSYHPVTLSALGDFLHRYSGDTHMSRWKDHLETSRDTLMHINQRIIGLRFSSLIPSEQLLFLDIALYARKFSALSEEKIGLVGSRWLEWVSELHDVTAAVMERRLQDLTRSGMIHYDDADFDDKDGVFNVPVPTLLKEFAEWYATEHGMKGLKNNSWGVCQPYSGAVQNRRSSLSDLVRLRVFDLSHARASARLVASKTMQELHNLEVLQLHSCPTLTELNLQGLDSLRHLELVNLEILVTVTLSGSSGTDEDLGIYESLRSVMLNGLDSLTHGPDLRSCRSLHWLRVAWCPKWTNLEQIGEYPYLQDLALAGLVPEQWASIPIVESLPSMQHFYLRTLGCVDVRDVIDAIEGLECWHQLENRGDFMLAELLRHLRSVMVDDLSADVVDNNRGWFSIEWNRGGPDMLVVEESRGLYRKWKLFRDM